MTAANWLIDHVLETTDAGAKHHSAIIRACASLDLLPYHHPVRYREIRMAITQPARAELDAELSTSVSAYAERE